MTGVLEETSTELADMYSYLNGAVIAQISSIAPDGSDLECAVAALRQARSALSHAITQRPEQQLIRKKEAVMHCHALKREIEQLILYSSSSANAKQKTLYQFPREIYAAAMHIVFLLSDELA